MLLSFIILSKEGFYMSRVYIVTGNGFTIDLINKMKKEDQVDLQNLFSKGDEVVWPGTKEKGFLSYKYCKHLWTLGARTSMSKEDSIKFIEDIITCLNVFNLAKSNNQDPFTFAEKEHNIYINAHNELSTYLRNLFIYYNSLITDDDLKGIIDKVPLIQYIKDKKTNCDEIIIITYNYDIYLERLLNLSKIPFAIEGFSRRNAKVRIVKPHGSISFTSKTKLNKKFEIKSTFDSIEIDLDKLELDNKINEDNSLVNVIIPPAGDSNRQQKGWNKSLREILKKHIDKSDEKDELIIFGVSYWHVDRMELDEIITTINPRINVKYVNPFPTSCFNAVLGSIFNNYIHVKKSESLLEGR
jgi:hypothetical protein